MVLFATQRGSATPLEGGAVLWRTLEDAQGTVLSSDEHRALAACTRFAPRELHIQRLVRAFSFSAENAARAFDALEARGLLRTPEQMLEGAAAAREPDAPPPLIAIRSYQRPEGLRHLLDSLLADERTFAVARRYVVIDDTLSREFARQTTELVAAFARATASQVSLLGLERRDGAVADLLEGMPPDHVRALLQLLDPAHPTAVTGSRTWNWAVLLAAGGTLSILDDDTRFPLRLPDAARETIDLLDANEPVVRYFDDAAALCPPLLAGEPYAWLGRWLGQPARSLLRRHGYSSAYLLHRTADELAHLRGDARVLGVVPGTYGSIPLDSSVFLTYLGASRADLWRAPYRHERLAADCVWAGFEAPRLTSFASYTPLLLDDRELLPFAGTWGRVDDTYFLALAKAVAPNAAFAHVPALLGHRDYAPRDRLRNAAEPMVVDRNAYIGHVLSRLGATAAGGGREARLVAVGAACDALSRGTDASLRDDVLRFRAAMRMRVTAHLQAALEREQAAPPEWRAHAERIVAVNEAATARDAVDQAELGKYRAALRQVADVAPLWPGLWMRAKELGVERLAADARPS